MFENGSTIVAKVVAIDYYCDRGSEWWEQGNNYGDKTVGARENDLLRICLFLKKENFH